MRRALLFLLLVAMPAGAQLAGVTGTMQPVRLVAASSGTTLPADSAGVLLNDGAGSLSWEPFVALAAMEAGADEGDVLTIVGGVWAAAAPAGGGGNPTIVTKTQADSPVTLVAGDSLKHYNNIGASGALTLTLPTAAAGLSFTVCVLAAQTVTLAANTGDTIRIGSDVTATAGHISSNSLGSCVTATAHDATQWIAESFVGTWSFDL